MIIQTDSIEQVAEKMNGREYGEELTWWEELILKNNGIVVAFWASDDLVEFRWAIIDEVGYYKSKEIPFDENWIMESDCEEDCPYFHEYVKNNKKWTVTSRSFVDNRTHDIETTFEHSKFTIKEEWEDYCIWVVFKLK